MPISVEHKEESETGSCVGALWLSASIVPDTVFKLPQQWKAPKAEEPEFANDPPTLEEAYKSVTDTDPWAKAEGLLQDGLSMQQVSIVI